MMLGILDNIFHLEVELYVDTSYGGECWVYHTLQPRALELLSDYDATSQGTFSSESVEICLSILWHAKSSKKVEMLVYHLHDYIYVLVCPGQVLRDVNTQEF